MSCRSRIVRGLSGPLTYTLVISTLLSIYETALASHALPEGFTCGHLALHVGPTHPMAQTCC